MTQQTATGVDIRLPNHLVAALALYLLGGARARQNAEEVAVKCFELAPQRFSWRKYPQYPSEIRTRDALGDAKKTKYGSLVSGSSQTNWILTPNGVTWCQEYLASEPNGNSVSGSTKLTVGEQRDLSLLSHHPQFQRFLNGEPPPSQAAVADTVNLLPDAPAAAVLRRIEDLSAAAHSAEYGDIERFLQWLKKT